MEILGLVNIPLWLLAIITFVFSLYRYSKWKHSYWRTRGVPGPPPTPFLGTLGMIRKKGIFNTDMECVQKYGKVYGSYIGHIPQLNVADPDLVKELLVKRFSEFTNRFKLGETPEEMKGMLSTSDDEHWKLMRNILTATFSSGKMRMTSPAIADCCEKLVYNVKEKSKDGKEVLEFKEMFGCYTMDVICSTAFGIDVNSQKEPNNEFVKQAKRAFNISFASPLIMLILIFPSLAKVLKLLSKIKLRTNVIKEIFDFFKKVTMSVIEDRKVGKEKRKDLMQIMLDSHNEAVDAEDKANMVDYKPGDMHGKKRGLTIDEVTANCFLFFLAGYDTTANTLSFMVYNLALNPDCQEKCVEEVDRVLGKDIPDYDNVLKLEYLDRCMNETLRLQGPASVTNRSVDKECEIAGYKVDKGTNLNICIYAIHHDPEYWPDPDKFDPDRFLPEEVKRRHPYAFLPFGQGPRNCIGMRLAYMEAKAAIASILQKYKLTTCDETEVPLTIDPGFGLLRPKNGIKLKVQPRY